MSIYIQVTERCPQKCIHCCMNASMKGRDMEWDVFLKGIALSNNNYDEFLTIGGGEPTIWKHFSTMIDWLWTRLDLRINIFIVTSGIRKRNTMKAVKLMEYHEETEINNFQIVLSDPYDGFHNPSLVNQDVYQYFLNRPKYRREEAIRTVDEIIPAGRGALLNPSEYQIDQHNNCPCEDTFMKPDGSIRACGCPDSPVIGDVWTGIDDHYEECYQKYA